MVLYFSSLFVQILIHATPCVEPQTCLLSNNCQTLLYLQGNLSPIRDEIVKVCRSSCYQEYKQSLQCLAATNNTCTSFWSAKYALDWNMHCTYIDTKICSLERLDAWSNYTSVADIRQDVDNVRIPCDECTKRVKYYELEFDTLWNLQGVNTTAVSSPLTDRILGENCGPNFLNGYSTSNSLVLYDNDVDHAIQSALQPPPPPPFPVPQNTDNGLIIGLSCGGGVFIMLLLGLAYWYLKKQKIHSKMDQILTAPAYGSNTLTQGHSSLELSASEDLYYSKPTTQ